MNYSSLLNEYPKIISSTQLCAILHISKRKASWMLQNGYIPCKQREGKTRKFEIQMTDVIKYIQKSEDNPELFRTPVGRFTASLGEHTVKYGFPKELPNEFRTWLENMWFEVPDLLTIDSVIKLTGYSDETINRWFNNQKLKSIIIPNDRITTKQWLIDFYIHQGYLIQMMSKEHVALLQSYFAASKEASAGHINI